MLQIYKLESQTYMGLRIKSCYYPLSLQEMGSWIFRKMILEKGYK